MTSPQADLAAQLEQDRSAGFGSFDSDLLADFFGANLFVARSARSRPDSQSACCTHKGDVLEPSITRQRFDALGQRDHDLHKLGIFPTGCEAIPDRLHENQRRPGNVLRRLDHDRVPGGECGDDRRNQVVYGGETPLALFDARPGAAYLRKG